MEELILRYMKKLDEMGRITVPAEMRKVFGEEYYVELYEDYIKLIPIKKEK